MRMGGWALLWALMACGEPDSQLVPVPTPTVNRTVDLAPIMVPAGEVQGEGMALEPPPPPASPLAAIGMLHLRSTALAANMVTACPAVLMAADVIVVAAHCFDWHRQPGKPTTLAGNFTFQLADGTSVEVAHAIIHPDYQFVYCDDQLGSHYLPQCVMAAATCTLLHGAHPSRYRACLRRAYLRVRGYLGGATNDLAVGFLRQNVDRVAPMAPLAKLQLEVGQAMEVVQWEAETQEWHTQRTTLAALGEHDFELRLDPDMGEYATLALASLPQGYALVAVGSRATTVDNRQGRYLFARIDAASTWLEQMLGARLASQSAGAR